MLDLRPRNLGYRLRKKNKKEDFKNLYLKFS